MKVTLLHTASLFGVILLAPLLMAPFVAQAHWMALDPVARLLACFAWFLVVPGRLWADRASMWEALRRAFSFERLATGVAVGVVFLPVYAHLGTFFPALVELADRIEVPGSPGAVAWSLLLLNGFLTPFCEEVFWREGLWQRLEASRGEGAWLHPHFARAAPLLVTSAGFALSHVVLDLSLARIPLIFLMGLFLGAVRARCGVWGAYGAHAAMNVLATAEVLF